MKDVIVEEIDKKIGVMWIALNVKVGSFIMNVC